MQAWKDSTEKINTKNKYYAMLASTSLSGNLIMCRIIFTGVKSNAIVEIRQDLTAETIGDISDNLLLSME